jgi:8-hydroxy-5-deazaflavin:NADPH oxidoreductase
MSSSASLSSNFPSGFPSGTTFGVLGTGMVGAAIATKLVELGYAVMMGSRSADNAAAAAWLSSLSSDASDASLSSSAPADRASVGTFADAAAFGSVIVLCTAGNSTLEALRLAKHENFHGKIIIDITNPLNFAQKSGPSLYISGGMDSLAEQVQRTLQGQNVMVVKTLNTVTADVMVNPARIGTGDATSATNATSAASEHDLFIAGNDDGAKDKVRSLLTEGFGWQTIHDLGDLTGARAMEGHLLLWIRLWSRLGTPHFNIRIVKE